MSKSLFERTSLKLGCNAQYDMELELNSDPDMYIFFEKGMRVSQISNRYGEASSKHLRCHDPKQESKYIIYLVANNLYIHATSKFLPMSGFKRRDPKKFELNK